MHENREISSTPWSDDQGRSAKATSRTADMYGRRSRTVPYYLGTSRTREGNLPRRLGREGHRRGRTSLNRTCTRRRRRALLRSIKGAPAGLLPLRSGPARLLFSRIPQNSIFCYFPFFDDSGKKVANESLGPWRTIPETKSEPGQGKSENPGIIPAGDVLLDVRRALLAQYIRAFHNDYEQEHDNVVYRFLFELLGRRRFPTTPTACASQISDNYSLARSFERFKRTSHDPVTDQLRMADHTASDAGSGSWPLFAILVLSSNSLCPT